ncbi:MAG: twin-arginine translocation signal domain-containing protein [Gaiellaceae bacterium]
MVEERRTNRRKFLRGVGVTLAAAIGAAALSGKAHAIINECCYDPINCPSCPGTQVPYFCNCDPFEDDYCICRDENTGCFEAAC